MAKLKPVPKRIRAPLDGEDLSEMKVQETIDDFFAETRKFIVNNFGESPNFEIKSQGMELSDNRLTYLIYNDRCVAGVFEKRTEFNNLEFIFFRNLNNIKRLSEF